MVHRLHKAIVPHTNKKNIIHDLMEYQRELHGLRFALETELEDDPHRDDGLCELSRLGLLDSSYFETSADLLMRGVDLEDQVETEFHSGSSHIIKVACHGHRRWAAISCPYLPRGYLSDIQLVELYKAYEALGTQSIQSNRKISYYNKVSYIVRDSAQSTNGTEDTIQGHTRPTQMIIENEDTLDDDDDTAQGCTQMAIENEDTPDDDDNGVYLEMRKITIKVDDVIEFLDESPDSFHGRGFGRVAAIMVHGQMVFIIITWITATGQTHP